MMSAKMKDSWKATKGLQREQEAIQWFHDTMAILKKKRASIFKAFDINDVKEMLPRLIIKVLLSHRGIKECEREIVRHYVKHNL